MKEYAAKKLAQMKGEWESMTIEELFALRELMQKVLSEKLKARKAEIEHRLKTLNQPSSDVGRRLKSPRGPIS